MKTLKSIVFCALAIFAVTLLTAKPKKFHPPGCVKLNDTLFVDETEISNLSWREYVSYLAHVYGDSSLTAKRANPDTTVYAGKEGFPVGYYSLAKYNLYPVVGISYEQAKAFAQWRTEMVKMRLKKVDKLKLDEMPVFSYRLASPDEYKFLLNKGYPAEDSLNAGAMNIKDRKNNPNWPKPKKNAKPAATLIAETYAYFPNRDRLYGMYGNVAEMSSEQGIAFGGSYRHSYAELFPAKAQEYSKPAEWLGFRCVCIVKNKK